MVDPIHIHHDTISENLRWFIDLNNSDDSVRRCAASRDVDLVRYAIQSSRTGFEVDLYKSR